LIEFIRRFVEVCRRRKADHRGERERKAAETRCVPIQDPAFVRPAPLVYSQPWLSAHGFNVTWDNPDFGIFHLGTPVSSHALLPATDYEVVVRVWNASVDAPVVDMPVHLSYLSFGMGTVSHAVATRSVDVGVKGGAKCPAFVTIPWTTPPEPGHYCLQALLDPVDDVDFGNNLGQHNTQVAIATSPATFAFALHNATGKERTYSFVVDTYELGTPKPCIGRSDGAYLEEQRAAHRGDHPLPPGWDVLITPNHPTLANGTGVSVTVVITPPSAFTGTKVINVHGYYHDLPDDHLAGGVTVTVQAGV
jgi:hypothetical protein